eukprot:5293304-Pyramimonas_sp.AAC.1
MIVPKGKSRKQWGKKAQDEARADQAIQGHDQEYRQLPYVADRVPRHLPGEAALLGRQGYRARSRRRVQRPDRPELRLDADLRG